jgi:cysteine desulfuration protein SufE
MAEPCCSSSQYGSEELDRLANRLSGTPDPRKRYEYVLWLAKKLPSMPADLQTEDRKVQGCVSQVFIHAALQDNHVHWQGESDALITKGLLALLIKGMSDLTPDQVLAVDPAFIAATGSTSKPDPFEG